MIILICVLFVVINSFGRPKSSHPSEPGLSAPCASDRLEQVSASSTVTPGSSSSGRPSTPVSLPDSYSGLSGEEEPQMLTDEAVSMYRLDQVVNGKVPVSEIFDYLLPTMSWYSSFSERELFLAAFRTHVSCNLANRIDCIRSMREIDLQQNKSLKDIITLAKRVGAQSVISPSPSGVMPSHAEYVIAEVAKKLAEVAESKTVLNQLNLLSAASICEILESLRRSLNKPPKERPYVSLDDWEKIKQALKGRIWELREGSNELRRLFGILGSMALWTPKEEYAKYESREHLEKYAEDVLKKLSEHWINHSPSA
jgi:hypothetical protein